MNTEELEDEKFKLDFYIRRNTRYHMRRSSFFTFWSRATAFIGVVFGSAAAASLLTDALPQVTAALALFIVAASAIDLVAGTGPRAWLHNDLRRKYIELDAELAECSQPSDELIRTIRARIKRIEADEPPVMHALELIAFDDAVLAVYSREEAKRHLSNLNGFQRMTAHVWPWDTLKA